MAKQRLSFKRHPRITGLAGIGNPYRGSDVKRNGKVVGCIAAPNYATKDKLFKVRFMIYDDSQENCNWKWVQLRFRGESDQECRDFIVDNWESFCETLDMREDDD